MTLTGVLIQTLLHLERLVWVVTASPIFDRDGGAWAQKGRVARVKGKKTGFGRVRECERSHRGTTNGESVGTRIYVPLEKKICHRRQ